MVQDKQAVLLVGTRKGLWVGRSGEPRDAWRWDGPHFVMDEVYSCLVDTRTSPPRLLAGAMSNHYGPQVFRSDDLGATWQETPNGAIRFPDDTGAALEQIWQLVPGGADEPGVVYAGTQPSALFRSEDRGETFEMVRPLWDHPHRPEWRAGFGGQAVHTILPHPTDASRMLVAMSTGGVYRSDDARASWSPANTGISAIFMPEGQQYPEFGQCVHKVARHPGAPERLFAQNHCGVYRSDDGAGTWTSIADGLPSDFGFAMVVHPHEPETVYVFPIDGAECRFPPGATARVWRSPDAGTSWEPLGSGLPDGFYAAVMRDAMCTDDAQPAGVYLGARDGSVFASNDGGDSWREIARNLPDVMVVRAAVVPDQS
jgi:hypothetical protein